MVTDYIPSSDIGFDLWFENFTNYVFAYHMTLSVTILEKNSLISKNNAWGIQYDAHISAKAADRGAKEM